MREKLVSILSEYENKPINITGFIFELGVNWRMPEGYKMDINDYEDSIDIFLIDKTNEDNNVHLMFEEGDSYTISKEITESAFVDEWAFEINTDRFMLGFELI